MSTPVCFLREGGNEPVKANQIKTLVREAKPLKFTPLKSKLLESALISNYSPSLFDHISGVC